MCVRGVEKRETEPGLGDERGRGVPCKGPPGLHGPLENGALQQSARYFLCAPGKPEMLLRSATE